MKLTRRENSSESTMDEGHKERELVTNEDTAENAPQRSVVVAGNPAAVSCIQFPQGETPTINITSGGIALFGDIAAVNYCSPELREDIETTNEKVSKVEVENGGKKKKRKNRKKRKKEKVEKLRDDVGKMRDDMEKLNNTEFEGTMQTQGQPNTEEAIDDMKAKYKIENQKHGIHKVDFNGKIVLEEVDVEEFAVKLRMSDPMPAMETLRGEADRYFEQLEGKRGCYIEMDELIHKNKRVTFVTGIAGSGKSVVVKQMTYKWANGERNQRKQFKHLTLMEFLSAIYVCTAKEHDEIIKDILKTRSYQVLFFYCQLMSGLMYNGIIKNLFTNALQLEESDAKSFFCNILKLVRECVGDNGDSLNLSIDVIMCLMNADVISKQFILSIVNQLSFKKVGMINSMINNSSNSSNNSSIIVAIVSNVTFNDSSRKWIEMMKPLTVDFECSNDELKKAFKNVQFGEFRVSELNELKFAKYFGSVDKIILYGEIAKITTTVRDIRKEIDGIIEWVKVKRVSIYECKLEDKDIDDKITKSSKLERLGIEDCYVTEKGFFNLCKWMITVEEFELRNIKEMKVEWWNVLVEEIVNAKEKNDGDFALKKLEIKRCPLMNDEIKEKILQCGITLTVDGKMIHAREPIPPSLPKNRSPAQSWNQYCMLI